MLECSDDTVFINALDCLRIEIFDMDWKSRPNTKILPDWSPMFTENPYIETEWRGKYNLSPPSAHVCQYVPIPHSPRKLFKSRAWIVILLTEVKYVKQDIV